ncbi:MAG: spore coat protein [Bacilli bacterium]|nr:spore coat protein [Bacilli bacterium]
MSEKEELTNYLTLTKSLVMLYTNAVVESSNKNVRKAMLDGLDYNLEMQEEIYQDMVNIGYYKVEDVNKTEVDKLCKKLNQDC